MVQLQLSLLFVAAYAFIFQQVYGGKVMMEYIGATGVPVSFHDVPISDEIDFNFILGFAVDADAAGNIQNGKFSPYWIPELTPKSVADIKAAHHNVKFMVSLSGWSIGKKPLHWYIPKNTEKWISNAVSSLTSIITTYHLDGIDIDYEKFQDTSATRASFADCIGELITRLKHQGVISVASIAPYDDTVAPYIELFKGYGHVIDYVNYQFYAERIKTPKEYLKAFENQANQFDKAKLLPAYEVKGRGIQGDIFFAALNLLKKTGFQVNGVMIFSADASSENNYYYEKKSQAFLLNSKSV